MPLVTTQQFGGLQPDITGAISGGLANRQVVQEQANRERLREQSQTQLATRQKALGVSAEVPANETQIQAELRAIADDPQGASQFLSAAGIVNQRQKEDAASFASQVLNAPPELQNNLINNRILEITARGGDPSNTMGLLEQTQEQRNLSLRGLEAAALSSLQRETIETQRVSKPASQTSLYKNLVSSGFTPGTPEFKIKMAEGMKKSPLVTIGGGKKEQEKLAELRAKRFDALLSKADDSEQQIASLDILDSIDVSTGSLEPMKLALASFAEGLGIDASALANVPAGQVFTAEAGRVVLRVLSTQKGPQTDNDRKEIAKTISRLGNTPEANVFINNVARSTAKRTIEQRDFFNDYLEQNETLGGADSAWSKFKKDTPMVSKFVKTPEGLPVFYFRFRERVMEANPTASNAEVIDAWKSQENAARANK